MMLVQCHKLGQNQTQTGHLTQYTLVEIRIFIKIMFYSYRLIQYLRLERSFSASFTLQKRPNYKNL